VIYNFDTSTDLSKCYGIQYNIETDNITDIERHTVAFKDSSATSIYKYFTPTFVASKKIKIICYFTEMTDNGIVWDDVTQLIMDLDYTSDQDKEFKISDIQLLGGPEHDIRGQPYYSSPGIDDLDEWTLSGNTNPTWDSGNSCYSLEDSTAGDNANSLMSRTIPFNLNGSFVQKFTYQFQADDDSTDAYKRLRLEIKGKNGDRILVFYRTPDLGVTWQWYIEVESGGNANYGAGWVFAPDTNWHDVVVYFHKEYGLSFFIDGKILFSDRSIAGTWTDWTQDYVTLTIKAQHDNGEKSHVHVKDIKIEPLLSS